MTSFREKATRATHAWRDGLGRFVVVVGGPARRRLGYSSCPHLQLGGAPPLRVLETNIGGATLAALAVDRSAEVMYGRTTPADRQRDDPRAASTPSKPDGGDFVINEPGGRRHPRLSPVDRPQRHRDRLRRSRPSRATARHLGAPLPTDSPQSTAPASRTAGLHAGDPQRVAERDVVERFLITARTAQSELGSVYGTGALIPLQGRSLHRDPLSALRPRTRAKRDARLLGRTQLRLTLESRADRPGLVSARRSRALVTTRPGRPEGYERPLERGSLASTLTRWPTCGPRPPWRGRACEADAPSSPVLATWNVLRGAVSLYLSRP